MAFGPGVSSILVPTKFLIIMTHLLGVLTSQSVKQENILAGLAVGTTIKDDSYLDAESTFEFLL